MTDYDFCTENDCCDNTTRTEEYIRTYCINPIDKTTEVKNTSWLDDFGWI
jgi:hypothetical protein